MAPPISICVAVCNEQARLRPALESARACRWCDELLVFDSGSGDGTMALAREYADRVETHAWVNYSVSKRRMTDAARNDWVFILDADEQISPELAAEIGGLDDALFARHPIFTVPRKNYLFGRHMRCWGPDRIDRLFHRRRVRWKNQAIHDSRVPLEGVAGHLNAPLLHNLMTPDEWKVYFDGPRYSSRVDMLAREMLENGKRVGFWELWTRPSFTFLKYFLLKGGFMQGTRGLLAAQKSAVSVQLKYARLWHLQQQIRRGLPLPEPAPDHVIPESKPATARSETSRNSGSSSHDPIPL